METKTTIYSKKQFYQLLNTSTYNKLFSPGFLPGIKPALSLFILLFCLSLPVHAQQNLVINGDFEEYSSCPQSESSPFQVPYEIEKCIGWKAPTYGTSDYFNVCSINSVNDVPFNAGGEQWPFTGGAYLGFASQYRQGMGTDGYNGPMWWEYIQGKLIAPLEPGKAYTFSMEVSLVEYSDLMINELGVYFSQNPISSANTASLNVIPQCVFFESNYFRDTVNWVHLEMNFTANGGEQYLTIGNFRNNITTDTLRRYNNEPLSNNPNVIYFYIDNVVLTDPSAGIPVGNVFTPNGDGINDVWTFPFAGKSGESKITILNRWGNRITEGDAKGFTWDGKTVDGKECTDGTYFYRINNSEQAGFIELMR